MDEVLKLSDFETYRSGLFPVELNRMQDVLGADDPNHFANPVAIDAHEITVSQDDKNLFPIEDFKALVLEKVVRER